MNLHRHIAPEPDYGIDQVGSINVEDLSHWFGSKESRVQALFDIQLELPQGTLTILEGPSGSGKTTLLTLMGCLRHVQHGSIKLLSCELNGASEATLVKLRRRLGFIFQAHNLHDSLTAEQNVLMSVHAQGRGRASNEIEAARHMLELLGLADRMQYLPASLSGGQKQRVAVARALIANPSIVFADEPTAALDAESGLNVVRLLKDLGQYRGTTTVLVSHDPRIMELADRVVTLRDGRLEQER